MPVQSRSNSCAGRTKRTKMIKIHQLEPTVVVQTEDRVLKIFPTSDGCEEQVNLLARDSSPILSQLSTGEKLRLVSIAWRKGSVLAMDLAKGRQLSVLSHEQDGAVVLAAKLLASRHFEMASIGNKHYGPLLGDFVIDHLFYDNASQTMTLIDPGMNFCVDGNLAEDWARFIFSACDAFRWKPLKAARLAKIFTAAYLSQSDQDLPRLKSAIKARFDRSREKYRLQKTPIRALASSWILAIHFTMLRLNLRRLHD